MLLPKPLINSFILKQNLYLSDKQEDEKERIYKYIITGAGNFKERRIILLLVYRLRTPGYDAQYF